MELQLFVGSMTRLYTPENAAGEDLSAVMASWRDTLAHGLADQLDQELYWEEEGDLPCVRTHPTWAGFYALLLTVLAAEQGESLPEAERWMEVFEEWSIWKRAQKPGYRSDFFALLHLADVYLPLQQEVAVNGPDPSGEVEIEILSAGRLLDALQRLNARLWQADADTISAWYALPAHGVLSDCAKRAFAHFYRATSEAMRLHLPLCPEY